MKTKKRMMTDKKHSQSISRRQMMLLTGTGALITAVGAKLVAPKRTTAMEIAEDSPITADEALKRLMEGNQRYVKNRRIEPDQDQARLHTVSKAQHPFATILGCIDSRVAPELLFDQGLGDLFVIRVAGNIIDEAILGSIEFGAVEFGVPLVMVLGHERCGAVTAALKGGDVPAHIARIVDDIQPAIAQVKGQTGDPVENVVRANIKMVTEQIKSSQPLLAELVQQGKVKVVGCRYDLDTGEVDMLV